jgi:hypothetical protein
MTIWLLALLLLASLAGLGYRQGAIRVAFSFIGILIGAVLAVPLGHVVTRVLTAMGLKNPVIAWALGPLLVFILISIAIKGAAVAVHHKVDVYYKYRAGDLRLALWERLNHRLGLCLGLLNGTAYLVLLSFVIYIFSYWTVQVASSDNDPKLLRLFNTLGRHLQSSGFIKVARAVDSMPRSWYEAADVTGLIYRNPLVEARLWRYPAFLGLAEQPEIQNLVNDKTFAEARQRQDPIMSILDQVPAQQVVNNPDLLRKIWATATPDLQDLRGYLETGLSPKYDPEKILGRWRFDVGAAINAARRANPNISSTDMLKRKKFLAANFDKTSLVAMTDGRAKMKNVPPLKLPGAGAPASSSPQTMEGRWQSLDGGKYALSFAGTDLAAQIEADHLAFKAEGLELVFSRED